MPLDHEKAYSYLDIHDGASEVVLAIRRVMDGEIGSYRSRLERQAADLFEARIGALALNRDETKNRQMIADIEVECPQLAMQIKALKNVQGMLSTWHPDVIGDMIIRGIKAKQDAGK